MRAAMKGVSESGGCMKGVDAGLRYSAWSEASPSIICGRRSARPIPASWSRPCPSIEPLNASEDFALCVAARNPAAARDLALSEPGSEAENGAAGRLADSVAPCTDADEGLSIDLQSLRALASTALYRGVTDVLASN